MTWRTRRLVRRMARAERKRERDRLSGWNPRRGVYEKGGVRPRGVEPFCEGWSGRMDEHDEAPGCEC